MPAKSARKKRTQPKATDKLKALREKREARERGTKPRSHEGTKGKTRESHPLADLLPIMSAAELEALKADIDANRQREPIVLLDGKILDGRNRYAACIALGKEPIVRQFDPQREGSPLSYVISKATHRNMTDTQKACASLVVKEKLAEEAQARMEAGGQEPVPEGQKGQSRDKAGALFGVSGRYVSDAAFVRSADPELFEKCRNGDPAWPLSRAKRFCHRTRKANDLKKKARVAAKSTTLEDVQILTGSCLDLAPTYKRGFARLIFCDPQYNIGYDYGGKDRDDAKPDDQYLNEVYEWMTEAHRLLTPDGSLWVLISDEFAAEFVCSLKRIGFVIRNWIKWFEGFGNNCASKFNRTSRHLLYAAKSADNFVFNHAAVNRPSDRAVKHADKRAVPGGKNWDDVWGINPPIPRLVDNAAERIPDFPTQLPLALVQPIIECASEPGDTVMDFFSGSGTTAVACLRTGRKFRGFEIDPQFAGLSRIRLQSELSPKEKP